MNLLRRPRHGLRLFLEYPGLMPSPIAPPKSPCWFRFGLGGSRLASGRFRVGLGLVCGFRV